MSVKQRNTLVYVLCVQQQLVGFFFQREANIHLTIILLLVFFTLIWNLCLWCVFASVCDLIIISISIFCKAKPSNILSMSSRHQLGTIGNGTCCLLNGSTTSTIAYLKVIK